MKNRVWCPAEHISALVWAVVVVAFEAGFHINLHLVKCLIPFYATHNAEMPVQQGSVQPFNGAITLWPSDLGRAVLDLLKL